MYISSTDRSYSIEFSKRWFFSQVPISPFGVTYNFHKKVARKVQTRCWLWKFYKAVASGRVLWFKILSDEWNLLLMFFMYLTRIKNVKKSPNFFANCEYLYCLKLCKNIGWMRIWTIIKCRKITKFKLFYCTVLVGITFREARYNSTTSLISSYYVWAQSLSLSKRSNEKLIIVKDENIVKICILQSALLY